MKNGFKRKIRLKREIKWGFKLSFIFLLVIYMQNNNYLKHLFNLGVNKYIDEAYLSDHSSISLNVDQATFSSHNEDINNDEIFTIKEEKNTEPIIYLYNTHQTEKYFQGNLSYKPTIVHASKYLKEKFDNSGLFTILENKNVSEVLDKNGWSYGSSYRVSRSFLEDTLNNNPSIKYLFDIHRDAGSHDYTTLCVNDKCYAKLLFLIGLENPNYMENQKYAEELSKRVNLKLKGLSKGILQKQGKKVNGIYNQDYSNRTILIEVGGENNTMNEVYNSLDILSEVLIDYIKEEINYGN